LLRFARDERGRAERNAVERLEDVVDAERNNPELQSRVDGALAFSGWVSYNYGLRKEIPVANHCRLGDQGVGDSGPD
jgi:hypothetical protein